MKVAIIVPLLVFLLAQTAWPFLFILTKFNLMTGQLSILLAGVGCLILAAIGPFLVLRYYISRVDPLMYVFSLFSWTCMAGVSISLELDGFVSNLIGFYITDGEPYFKTAYGTAVNYWDGTAQFLLYIGMIALYSARRSHREAGLFWAGSIVNSLLLVVPGGITGNHPFKMAILLNIPFTVLPILIVFKFFNERPPQSRTFLKYKPIWRRPIDFLFMLFFMFSIGVAAFRGMAVMGGKAEAMKSYMKNVEPYLNDPSNFPKLQILVYEHLFLGYYLAAIYGLVYPGMHWMTDWALIHAGAAAQAQFCHIFGSVHYRTDKALHAPMTGTPGLIFWTINISLAVVPLLFAWRCLSDYEMFGRTYNVERAELKEAEPILIKEQITVTNVKKSE